MKNKSKNAGDKGFTLVEILVGMAIFSMVLFTLFSSFDAFLASRRIIADQQARDPGTGLDIMVRDLIQVFATQPPQYMTPELRGGLGDLDRFRFSADEIRLGGQRFSTLSFTSLSPIQFNRLLPGAPGVTRLTYYVHPREDRFDLLRADRPLFLDEEKMKTNPCTDPVLIKNIRTFELNFSGIDNEVSSEWDSDLEGFGFTLPGKVIIRIGLEGDGPDRIMETWVRLPVSRQVVQ